jgi:hypothetical protein
MKCKIMSSLIAMIATTAAVVLGGAASPAQAAVGTYYHVTATQSVTTDGFSVDIDIENPYLDTARTLAADRDYHTLMQMAVANTSKTNSVEAGWMKDLVAFGNNRPHLFVAATTNGLFQGVNFTGWVDNTGNSTNIGADLVSFTGTTKTFAIRHTSNGWEVFYDGSSIGWYPDSVWTAQSQTFTQADKGYAYGETLSANALLPCSDMGNGIAGDQAGAAGVSNWSRWDSGTSAWVAGSLGTPFVDNSAPSNVYTWGNASATGFTLGGPGFSSISEATDNATGSCAPATAGTPNNTLVLWGQVCPDNNGSTGCTNKYNTAASCSPAPCLISGALTGVYNAWQNTSTSGKSFTVGRTAACTGTQLTLAPNAGGTAKGVLPSGWDGTNIKCIRRIA